MPGPTSRAKSASTPAPPRGLGLKLPPQRADTGPQYVQPAGYHDDDDDDYYESSDGGTTPARDEYPEQRQQQGWGGGGAAPAQQQLRGGSLAALRDSPAQRPGIPGGAGGAGPFSRGMNRHQMESLSGLRQPSGRDAHSSTRPLFSST